MIDAHHHYWHVAAQEHTWRTNDHDAIARDFIPADLDPHLRACGVTGTVLVQSADLPEENDRLASFALTDSVRAVVGWLPLRDPGAARRELERSRTPRWRGVRCLIGREDPQWLAEPAVRALFADLAAAGLSWDVVPVTAEQVAAVIELARALPDLRIVVDHLARPPIAAADDGQWMRRVRDLAACPNIAIKVSIGIDVLTAWDRWDPAALRLPVQEALAAFGPDRAMVASNWPVVTLRASYTEAWQGLAHAVEWCGLSESELADVRGASAARWYGWE